MFATNCLTTLLLAITSIIISYSIIAAEDSELLPYSVKERINDEKCTGKCLRKCCDFGYYLEAGRNCIPYNSSDSFNTFSDNAGKVWSGEVLKVGLMVCKKYLLSNESDTFYVLGDFSLSISSHGVSLPQGFFCLDHDVSGVPQALACFPEEEPNARGINCIGMIVSLPFLLATLLVYIITWENKIQQNCQLAYVFSLMCAYFFLIYIQLNSGLETVPCTILASLCFYFFMASFCWMNISCIDMYCTFSGMKGYNTFKRSSQWRRFTLYFLYAYGAPTLLLIIIFILNQGEDQSAWYHPRFSIGQCWLGHGYAVLLFFNGPMGFLLLANIILFLLTAMKIYQINKDTKVLRSRESQKHYDSNKQQFKIYVKLLLAMGINWIMEFISWLVDWVLGAKRVPEIWYITDFCNALYGVFIFILFVCKSTVWIKIKQKYYSWLGKPNMARALSARASTQNQMSMTYETTMT